MFNQLDKLRKLLKIPVREFCFNFSYLLQKIKVSGIMVR